MEQGMVFDIHRGTTHDGPGMRTTVFFKGCPLRCQWCHNPESLLGQPQLQWDVKQCIGCGTCVKICPNGAVSADATGITVDPKRCRECFSCAANCPSKALHVAGRLWNVEDLVREACKDSMFFEEFGGGVTVSGGEPVFQPDFLLTFLQALKARSIHTALDTSGYGAWSTYEAVFPYVDVFLYDIKLLDSNLHHQYTGVHNERILDNLDRLAHMLRRTPEKRLWIRTPLIPGATATEENLHQIGGWIQEHIGDVLERWELCAFNNVCKEKYNKLHLPWAFQETELMADERIRALSAIAEQYVGDRLVTSGLTRAPIDS